MKRILCLMAVVWLVILAVGDAQAASYAITNSPGWNLIANQLDNASGNSIRNVLPNPPGSARLLKFNRVTGTFNPSEIFTFVAGWLPGTNILSPGDGLMFSNSLSSNYVMTISGNPHLAALRVNPGNNLILVSRQTNGVGTFDNIMGFAPTEFSVLYRFNPGVGRDPDVLAPPHYTVYGFKGGAWTPSAPTVRIGESVWIATNGSAPTIATQPRSPSVCPGDRASFAVEAFGTLPLSYRWRLNGVDITGASNSTYVISAVQPGDQGAYTVVVSNIFGSTTSSVANVSFNYVVANGPYDTAACVSNMVTFTTTPVGAGTYTYSWYRNGVLIAGAGGNSLTIGPVTATQAGTYCVVIGATGKCSITNCAQLTVGAAQTTTKPADQTNCVGTTATFSTTPSGAGPFTFQWTHNGVAIAGATNSSLQVQVLNPITDAGNYCVTVSGGCAPVTVCGYLTVTTPIAVSGPFNQTNCPGAGLTLTTTVTGGSAFGVGVSYQWYKDGVLIAGATGSSYQRTATTTNDAGNYCVVVTGPCNRATNCALVRIADLEPPVLNCPSVINASCTAGQQGTPVTYGVTITDNCDRQPRLECVPPSGSTFYPGTTPVVCTGWDASGNTNRCSFEVQVSGYPPTLRCPNDMLVGATGPEGAAVVYPAPTVFSCYSNLTAVCTPPSGSVFPVGMTSVRCVATAPDGKQGSCGFTVMVIPASCCESKQWGMVFTNAPSPRAGAAMAYDAARGRVVLFGGMSKTNTSVLYGDTWEWDGANWTLVQDYTGKEPERLKFAAMAYDPGIGRVVLFGGQNLAGGPMDDTFVWDGTQWSRPTFDGPPARHSHAMATDFANSRVVLFGGSGAGLLGDTWVFDGTKSTWTQVSGNPSPSPRDGHAMSWDGSKVLLFGGMDGDRRFPVDTWRWDGGVWTMVTTNGPSGRAYTAMAYEDFCGRLTLFGGGRSGASLVVFNDTWEWDDAGWKFLTTNGPSGRWQHAMATDGLRRRGLLFGGTPTTDTWAWGGDRTPPQVEEMYMACGDTAILLTFSETVVPSSAENPANYSLGCGTNLIAVVRAEASQDGRMVVLQTAEPIPAGICRLNVNGIMDECGNVLQDVVDRQRCVNEPCPRSSGGTEFWLAFPGNYAPEALFKPAPKLFVTGSGGTVCQVTMPGLSTPFLTNFVLPAAGSATVTLPRAADLAEANDVIEAKGIRVLASRRVNVYGYDHVRYTTDAYAGLPKGSLGKAYMVMSYQNVFTAVPELSGVQFAVVGTEDDTSVTVVPSASVGVHPAKVPFDLLLMKGQTYQLRNTNPIPVDLTGTLLVADKPIAVFGSHMCANIPSSNVFFCDYIVEQLPPTDMWGTKWVTMPLKTRTKADTYRFLAMYDNTTLQGGSITTNLDRGEYYETRLTIPMYFTANKPMLAAQFANSSDYDYVTNSDPFMVLIPPTEHYGATFVVQTPVSDFPGTNWINVMAPSNTAANILIDGAPIAAWYWLTVPGALYKGAAVPVMPGAHTVASSDGSLFGVIVYGWGMYDSYGYPAGFCAPRSTVAPPQFTCPPTATNVVAGAACTTALPDLSLMVANRSAAAMIAQNPPAGTVVGLGTVPVTTTLVDVSGLRQNCTTLVTVRASSAPGLECPPDMVVGCQSARGTVVNYQPSLCNTNARFQCLPPSGTLFPVGTTTVSCLATNGSGPTQIVEQCRFQVTVECTVMTITSTSSNQVTIAWPGGGIIERATSLDGPWTVIPNAVSPLSTYVVGPQTFFRIIK